MSTKLKIKVEGLNLYRLIDKLVASEVCIFNLKIKAYYFTCEIDECYLNTFKNVCKKERKDFKILKAFGIKSVLADAKKMLGFSLALIIASAYLFSFKSVIFKLNVSYSSPVEYDMSKVNQVLEECGVKQGEYLKLSAKEIEDVLIKNVEDISGCRVIKDGSMLSICVYPEIRNEMKKNLFSKYDAVITKLEVFSGTAKKKVGDIVRKGDLLVESDVESNAIIEGKVYFSGYEIYNENQEIVTFTGRNFCNREFKILQKTILKDFKNNIFSQYLTQKCVFSLNKNLFIPIICEEEIVYEVEIKNKIVPFLEKEDEIKMRLLDDVKRQVGDEFFRENNVTFSIVRDGSYVRVDCFFEIEMSLI